MKTLTCMAAILLSLYMLFYPINKITTIVAISMLSASVYLLFFTENADENEYL